MKNSELIPGKLYKIDNVYDKEENRISFFNINGNIRSQISLIKSDNIILMFLYKKLLKDGVGDSYYHYYFLINNKIYHNYVYHEEIIGCWFDEI